MAAQFPQQKLFDLRKRAADEAERAFVDAHRVAEQCRAELGFARVNLKDALSSRLETAARRMVGQLGGSEAFVKRRRAEVENALCALEVAEASEKNAERAFNEAMVALKAIEKLKTKWEAEVARLRGRRTEAALDDLATARHGRERGGGAR
jgi:flagellar export protein FliJ